MSDDPAQLRSFIVDHYSLEEFRTLCFDLHVRFDSLAGQGIDAKARELILHLHRQSRLPDLLAALEKGRPDPFDQANFDKNPITLESAISDWGTYEHPLQDLSLGDALFRRFENAATELSQCIRIDQFRNLVRERSRTFVGRQFVFDAINDLIDDRVDTDFHSGYVLIHGEPGIGKTALMARLVSQHAYLHHFNVAGQNVRSAGDFLKNICAQIIVRYQLNHRSLPPAATKDSGFLSQLLSEATETSRELPIVIVVDALDEADDSGLPADANLLYLPATLPDGVFFVITTREMHEYRLSVDHRKDIWIDDDSPENLADVATFIRDFLAQNQTTMEVNIAAWGLEEADFVEVVTEKSQGNFMYLVHVLRDIRNGQLAPATLDSIYHLPIGLKEYYQRHWRTMREQDPVRFRDYYEPIVCILATAREAVPIRQLVEWTKARWPHLDASIIRDVIRTWREFLNEEQPASGPPIYRVYHASFQNFLEEEIDLSLYHLEIAETALRKIHGLDAID